MADFATKRMHIWEKVTVVDPILTKFRFCNVYRELDRQTIEFHTLLKPLADTFDLWLLNMAFCRMVCNPNTINSVGLLSFDESRNRQVFTKLRNLPSPKYGTAYIFPISAIMHSAYPTREEFFCLYLPKVMQSCAQVIRLFSKSSVEDALPQVLPVFGFNLSFHWTEILIDVAYQYPHLIDLFRAFPVGPGSRPTMQQLNARELPVDVCLSLSGSLVPNFPYLTLNGQRIWLSCENWEGIGCEFRKYSNLKLGCGRRRIYSK